MSLGADGAPCNNNLDMFQEIRTAALLQSYKNGNGEPWAGLFLVALLPTGIVQGEDWPWFRGPGCQGISREKGIPLQWSATSNIRWKTAIPGEGWSSPIVLGDRVFVTTALEGGSSLHLLCLDRPTGNMVWDKEITRQKAGHKQQYNSYATSTPATDGKRVYVPACDGRILAISAASLWAFSRSYLGSPRSGLPKIKTPPPLADFFFLRYFMALALGIMRIL